MITIPPGQRHGAPLPDRSVVPPVWGRITNLIVDHGEGCWLVTPEGDRYLDYTSGIGVTNTGHAHPRVVAAVQAQAAKLLHGQQNIVYHEAGLRLYDRLAHLLPGGPWSAFLSNSGAEAVEAAVKLARVATGRPAIIAFRYSFHGRTAQTMALTAAKDVYRGAFEPLPGSIYHAAYPYCYRAPAGPHDPADCTCDWEAQLDLLFHQLVFPDKVAGDHRGAGHRRGRLPRPAAGVPAAAPGDHPAARDPADRRRGPDGLRPHRRDLRGPPLGRGAGHPGHGQGHRVRPAAVGDHRPQGRHGPDAGGLPRRHLRRQRGRLRGGHGNPRRDRGGGPGGQRPRARGTAAGRPPRADRGPGIGRRRAWSGPDGRAGVREARRGRRARARTPS